MSDLVFKGYKKWQRENCGWHLTPTDKQVKRKHFRCLRRIIKTQTMKDGSVLVNGKLPDKVDFLIVQNAEMVRKDRQQRKSQKQTYHDCGNRQIRELQVHPRRGDIMVAGGSWSAID